MNTDSFSGPYEVSGSIRNKIFLLLAASGIIAISVLWLYRPSPNSPGRPAEGELHRVSSGNFIHHYYQRGSGPTIVFLPSLGRPASDFNELTGALSQKGFRTIAVDLNISRQMPDEPERDLMHLAEEVEAVVASLEGVAPGQLVIAGHAFGNRLARAYATLYPEKIRSIILLAAGGKVPIAKDITAYMTDCFDPQLSRLSRTKALRGAFFAASSSIPDYWRIGWDSALAQLQVQATKTTPHESWWDGGGRPMLVIQADEDTIAPAQHSSAMLKEEFGDRVTIAVASPAGHALLPEQPGFISETIGAYLD